MSLYSGNSGLCSIGAWWLKSWLEDQVLWQVFVISSVPSVNAGINH